MERRNLLGLEDTTVMQCEVAQLRPMETPSREVGNSRFRFCRAWSDIEARQDPIEHGPSKRDIIDLPSVP